MAATAQQEIDQGSVNVAADTIASADTLPKVGMNLHYGLVLEKPYEPPTVSTGSGNTALSWVLTVLILIFVVVCLRYKKNTRFFSQIIHDVVSTRERHNAFDDTLRETTFVWLLNLLWCGSIGFLIYGYLTPGGGSLFDHIEMKQLGLCIAVAGVYTLFLALAYVVVGALFSDGSRALQWAKGYLSAQGFEAILLFPLALLGLCVPGLLGVMIFIGIIVFLVSKLLFIYKGFCIFFTQSASWVLFLYYLCSLEIVPIVLAYSAARNFCQPL